MHKRNSPQKRHLCSLKYEGTESNRKVLKLIPILACIFMLLTGVNAASGEELSAPIIKEFDEGRGSFVKTEGWIPWGHGQISFDVLEGTSGIIASVSYCSKNGKTAEEVLCWQIVPNNDEKSMFECERWFVFPDGEQCNYTNPQPFKYGQDIHSVKLIPILADGMLSNDFPDIVGQMDSASDIKTGTKCEVNSEEKAISCAKKVYALQAISLGVDANQLEWTARLGEEGGWYVVTAWDPVAWDPQSPPYEVKEFNIKTNGETGAVKDYWFQELMESGKRIEISNLVLLKEEQTSLAEELMSFIQTVSPTDAQIIARWDLSIIADISINGSIHHIACFKFFGEGESYVGDVWTDLDDQHRIIQMELTSTALG